MAAAIGFVFVAQPSARFRILVFILGTAAVAVGMAQHEMWRDEMQAWLLARDSHGVAGLLRNLDHEGHPALWHLFLMPFTALGSQPQWMQAAQMLVASATLGLVVWKGPFSRLEMLLLPFGYCLLFEYGVKSRSYALGNLILLGMCAGFVRFRRRPIVLAVGIALLANVHALFGLIGLAMAAAMVADRLVARSWRTNWQDAVAVAIVALGLWAAVATAAPPMDSGIATAWTFDLARAHLSNTFDIFGAVMGKDLTQRSRWVAWSGLGLIGVALLHGRRAPAAAAFLAVGISALIGFFHVKYGPAPWHQGLLFIVVLAAVWISRSMTGGLGLLPRMLVVVMLASQAAVGIAALQSDAMTPYSQGHAVARLIRREGWPVSKIMTLDDLTGSTVLGYLGAPDFYGAPGARRFSFVVWDKARLAPIDLDAFFAVAANMGPAVTILDCGPERTQLRPVSYGYSAVAPFAGTPLGEDCIVYRWPG